MTRKTEIFGKSLKFGKELKDIVYTQLILKLKTEAVWCLQSGMVIDCSHQNSSMFLYGPCDKCQEEYPVKSPRTKPKMGLSVSMTENNSKVTRKVTWADVDDIRIFNEEHDVFKPVVLNKNSKSKIENFRKCLKPILKHRTTNCVIIVYEGDTQ